MPASRAQNAYALLEMESMEGAVGTIKMAGMEGVEGEEGEANNKKSPPKRVGFEAVRIREYQQVLGDHPCCLEGPPLALGWKHSPEAVLNLDLYESTRRPRRHRRNLHLDSRSRRCILLSHVSTDSPDSNNDAKRCIKRAERRLNRHRINKRAHELFFHPTADEPAQE